MIAYGTKDWEDRYAKLIQDRKQTQESPYTLLTPEWVSEYEQKIQGDARYKQAAKTWEGSVVLVFKAEPTAGLDHDIFVFMDLWHGECRQARIVPPEVGRNGEYVLEAEYERWKRVLKKELSVVREIATRKLKLVPFHFKKAAKLAAATQAAIRLVDLAADVSDRFPDELDPDGLASFRALYGEMADTLGI